VDAVVVFPEKDVRAIIREIRPDFHAKGTDYTVESVPERDEVEACGGRVVIVGDPKNHSATEIIRSRLTAKIVNGAAAKIVSSAHARFEACWSCASAPWETSFTLCPRRPRCARLFLNATLGWLIEERWAELLCTLRYPRSGRRSPQRPLVDRIHTVNTAEWRRALFVQHLAADRRRA
jgi:hypothetical protein